MFVIISKKDFKHRNHMAIKTYMALQEAEQQVKFYRAIAEGYKRAFEGEQKEKEFYKNMYEREVKKNEALQGELDHHKHNYYSVRVLPRGMRCRLP